MDGGLAMKLTSEQETNVGYTIQHLQHSLAIIIQHRFHLLLMNELNIPSYTRFALKRFLSVVKYKVNTDQQVCFRNSNMTHILIEHNTSVTYNLQHLIMNVNMTAMFSNLF